jgi:hypothetical protein
MIAARQTTDPADTGMFDPLASRLTLLADELAWWMTTLA